jgi:hypothetical protein
MTNITCAKHNRDDFLNRLVFCVVKVRWVVRPPPPPIVLQFQNLYFRWFRPFCSGRFVSVVSVVSFRRFSFYYVTNTSTLPVEVF